jgi:hypothetical protein
MSKGRFQSLQAKLAKFLVEWDDNHKSQAAKEVLIKAVAHEIRNECVQAAIGSL